MNGEFANRTVLITGSAGGIGHALARRFHEQGANLALVDLDEGALRKQAAELGERVVYSRCDTSIEKDVERSMSVALSQFASIDIAVLNAGTEGRIASLDELSLDDFQAVMDVNVGGVFMWLSRLMKIMKQQQHGVITITSSIGGLRGTRRAAAYVASKHAVIGLMKCAALEGASHNVRVNSVNPGSIDTRMMRSIEAGLGEADSVRRANEQSIPSQRYGTPDEVASMVTYLSSKDAAYCTGSVFVVDGGAMAGK